MKAMGGQNDKYLEFKSGNDSASLQLSKSGAGEDGRWFKLFAHGCKFWIQLDANGHFLFMESEETDPAYRRTFTVDLDDPTWKAAAQAKSIGIRKVATCRKKADGSLEDGFMLVLGSDFWTETSA
jgi:hypothetical protein